MKNCNYIQDDEKYMLLKYWVTHNNNIKYLNTFYFCKVDFKSPSCFKQTSPYNY